MLRNLLKQKADLEAKKQALCATIEPELETITDQIMKLNDQIIAHITPAINLNRKALEKEYGVVNVVIDGITVKHDIGKRVKWDQAKLKSVMERITASGSDPAEYIKVELKVEERKYSAWPKAIKDIFVDARTTEPGPVKVSFEEVETVTEAPALPDNVVPIAAGPKG